MKYKVEVGSFCTRFIGRIITVKAKDEEEAKTKAINEYVKRESKLASSNDIGNIQVDFIEVIE